jgi:drug/metabolite transporter (DMT)-like permease
VKNPFSGQAPLDYLLLTVLALIWGSSFVLMRLALFDGAGQRAMNEYDVAALRLVIASVALAYWGIRAFGTIKPEDVLPLLIVGYFGNAFPAILFTTAQLHVESFFAGILNSLTPVFTLLIAMWVFGIQYRWVQIVGVFVGLLGAGGLILGNAEGSVGQAQFGLLVVLATFFYAISVNVIRNRLGHLKPQSIAGASMLMVLPVAAGFLFFRGTFVPYTAEPYAPRAIAAVSTLALFGTSLSLVIFNRLIARTNALFAASVTYLMPVVAVMWGFVLKESFGSVHLLWTLVILSGVWMVNRKKQ